MSLMLHLLLCLLVAFWTVLVVAQVERQVILPNHSPTIVYRPYGDGFDPENGWTIWTSGAGFIKEGAQSTEGDIFHITARQGGSFTLGFYGTGISLSGTSNATYQVVVDGAESQVAGAQDVLFATASLELKSHTLTLTVLSNDENQLLSFANATITTSSPKQLESTIYPSYSSDVQYTGTWYPVSIPQGTWMKTNEYRASASMKFSGARAVAIHSPLNYGHWTYAVELDGKAMPPPGDGAPAFNASTWWLISDSILYYADDLDEGEHTIKMLHLANETFWGSTFTSFEVWRAEDSGSGSPSNPSNGSSADPSGSASRRSSGLSTGAYAGIGVGAFAVIVIATIAILFILRRRQRQRQPHYDSPILGPGVTHSVTAIAPPSPFLSIPTSQLPDTSSGSVQSPMLAYERQHDSSSMSNEKGDRPVEYASHQAPDLHLAGSPVTSASGTTATDEILEEVGSPPAYGNGTDGRFPRS